MKMYREDIDEFFFYKKASSTYKLPQDQFSHSLIITNSFSTLVSSNI